MLKNKILNTQTKPQVQYSYIQFKNHIIYICNFKLINKFIKLNIVINYIKNPTFQTDTKNIPLSTERGIYRNENVIFIYVYS